MEHILKRHLVYYLNSTIDKLIIKCNTRVMETFITAAFHPGFIMPMCFK